MNKNAANKTRPYLRSLDELKKGVYNHGYTENFIYKGSGHLSTSNSIVYDINKVKVISTIRFQGSDDPGDHAELYIVETPDGTKGTFEKK
ncbi:MAG: hypothetical protein EOP48_05155 [Sphingobacteriales bacterium]|nr:MAG: hypothetical protein EOP48_05155 [Sphingobacteriales bacterium]